VARRSNDTRETVLGTRIRSGPEVARAIMISDLHVPNDGGAVVEALGGALAAADRLGAVVFVLGDLFDTYVSRAQIEVGVWREVAARFANAVAGGGRVVVLAGNRDFLLGPEFVRAGGVELVAGGYRARIGGVDTLLLHGDELCQNDRPYQRAKRWLRAPVTRWLARRLPVAVARRVAERARSRSRRVIAAGDQERFLPTRAAVAAAFATGAERLVFGHIHRHASGRVGDGTYRVLPAFDVTATGLVVAADRCEPVRFAADGAFESLPEPSACPFGS
jgi:UDP-2,3-diacylglucosamine hydrolase